MKKYISIVCLFTGCFFLLQSCRSMKDRGEQGFTYSYDTPQYKNKDTALPVTVSPVSSALVEKLGIAPYDSCNLKLLEECAGWMGVPYCYGNCSKEKGTDCSGLTHHIYKEVYGKQIQRSSYDIYLQCRIIREDELREGDLVFFKIENTKVSHVGVYLAQRKFIHATTQKGVLVSSLDEPYYRKYYFASGRIPQNR